MPSSQASTYISLIKDFIKTIPFDSGTLDSKGVIFLSDKSKLDHFTEVHIWRDSLTSKTLDNVTNIRTHNIVISIVSQVENREAQSQEDIYYLEEQIFSKIEANLENINYFYLDNYNIQSKNRTYDNNFYVKDIPLALTEMVLV
jgi:hypothetical protein